MEVLLELFNSLPSLRIDFPECACVTFLVAHLQFLVEALWAALVAEANKVLKQRL